MLLLRLFLILSALAIILSGGLYLFTKNSRYYNFAVQVARFVAFAMLVFAVLFILERYILIGWRILL